MNLLYGLFLATMEPSGFKNVRRYFLSSNRGKQRVWLDGDPLLQAGFVPQARYSRSTSPDGTITLSLNDAGVYAVSKKERSGKTVPVIDINNSEIDRLLKDAVAIEVIFGANQIIISRSALDRQILDRESRLIDNLRSQMPLEAGSFYHGAGILDAALHEGLSNKGLAAHVRVAVEIEEDYLDLSRKNNSFWAPGAWAVSSPMELTLVAQAGSGLKLDLLTAGIPCTGASKAGLAKNHLASPEEHTSAGAQFYYTLEWVKASNPAMVLFENVPDYEKSASWAVMRAVLRTSGYDLQTRVFDGNDFGALESRSRFVALGVSRGLSNALAFDLHSVTSTLSKPETLSLVLDQVPLDSPMWRRYDYLKEKEVRDIDEGKGFRLQWLDPTTAESVGTIGRQYWKSRGTEPFIRHPNDPELARLLTVEEHARVKTIPTSIVDGARSSSVAHEVLGQSVIYEVFRSVGEHIGSRMHTLQTFLMSNQQDQPAQTNTKPRQNDLEWT